METDDFEKGPVERRYHQGFDEPAGDLIVKYVMILIACLSIIYNLPV